MPLFDFFLGFDILLRNKIIGIQRMNLKRGRFRLRHPYIEAFRLKLYTYYLGTTNIFASITYKICGYIENKSIFCYHFKKFKRGQDVRDFTDVAAERYSIGAQMILNTDDFDVKSHFLNPLKHMIKIKINTQLKFHIDSA